MLLNHSYRNASQKLGKMVALTIGGFKAYDSFEEFTDYIADLDGPAAAEKTRDSISVLDGKKVLIVDDTALIRKIFTKVLNEMGAEVSEAENGVAAVDLIRNNPVFFDAIFMDKEMPGICGIEATRQIRRLNFQGIIISISTCTDQSTLESFLAAGADLNMGKSPKSPDINRYSAEAFSLRSSSASSMGLWEHSFFEES